MGTAIENLKLIALENAKKRLKPQALAKLTEDDFKKAMELTKGYPEPFYPLILEGKYCERCGECCRQSDPIMLKEDDLELLEHVLGKNLYYYVKKDGDNFKFKFTKPCKFLKSDNACSIYNFRPFVCRQFPFHPTDKGEVGIAFYEYCKSPVKILEAQISSQLVGMLLERERPDLAKIMQTSTENFKKITDLLTPEQRGALFKAFCKDPSILFKLGKGEPEKADGQNKKG